MIPTLPSNLALHTMAKGSLSARVRHKVYPSTMQAKKEQLQGDRETPSCGRSLSFFRTGKAQRPFRAAHLSDRVWGPL